MVLQCGRRISTWCWCTATVIPAWRGGPLHEADVIGIAEMLRQVEALHAASGVGWEPAPLLREMAAAGKRFADLNG